MLRENVHDGVPCCRVFIDEPSCCKTGFATHPSHADQATFLMKRLNSLGPFFH